MQLFGKRPVNAEAAASAQTDQDRLAKGSLPLKAELRLKELGQNPRFFTSNLSVNELALAGAEGVRPLGQVMGSTVYHVGWQYTPMYASAELVTLSHAQTHARQLAVSRLQQEARLLGAHGVIGVRLERKSYDWGENLIEFAASGTAVALSDRPAPKDPFVCALSGQEFYALRRGGFFPVGFAFGTCTYYHVATYGNQMVSQSWGNVELTDYSKAIYHTRHAAMTRLEKEAVKVNAEGIVGVTIDKYITTRETEDASYGQRRDLIVEFTAFGTAIVTDGLDTLTINYGLPLGD